MLLAQIRDSIELGKNWIYCTARKIDNPRIGSTNLILLDKRFNVLEGLVRGAETVLYVLAIVL